MRMSNHSTGKGVPSNPVHLLHMGRRGRTKGPTERRGGIALPVEHWKFLDELAELRTLAYKKMEGETKQTPSGEIENAVDAYVLDIQKEYGPFPVTAEQRDQFTTRMADKMTKQLRDDLLKAS